MNYESVEIADLSVIYLTYDEPQREEFWLKIKNMVPWAVRVDNVKGSDAAHKAAAAVSDTERFILIDGDNLPDESFFDLTLDFNKADSSLIDAQMRWKAVNHINGLCYGNGGISSWTKTYVKNMRTHENSAGNPLSTVDFCLDISDARYVSMNDCYSVTYPNRSEFQAWRAGFREGVKMCLHRGKRLSVAEFKQWASGKNLNNLTVWHNVGSDVENGNWSIYGSRLGTYLTMLTDWDYTQIHWFDNYESLYQQYCIELDSLNLREEISAELQFRLDLPICTLEPEQSKFFKHHMRSKITNRGPLVTEMSVIRQQEGW